MDEGRLSVDLFKLALDDPRIQVLSWQGVDGKGYFTADVKFRLPSQLRVEPDLILVADGVIWICEFKARHSESLSDELKLELLRRELGDERILNQLSAKTGFFVEGHPIELGVAYVEDDVPDSKQCVHEVKHLHWSAVAARVARSKGLATVLAALTLRQKEAHGRG